MSFSQPAAALVLKIAPRFPGSRTLSQIIVKGKGFEGEKLLVAGILKTPEIFFFV